MNEFLHFHQNVEFSEKLMVGSSELFITISAVLVASGLTFMVLPRRAKLGALTLVFLMVTLGGVSQPSMAAAVDDDVLSSGQKALNENLKTTPHGSQYQGIEYPKTKGEPLSDRQITRKIRNEAPSNLKLSVSNGSVRISGEVSDRGTAQRLVQDIKEIPGVHEISYDLGLTS